MNEKTKIKKGFICGGTDILHAKHVGILKECRSQCDYFILGLQVDTSFEEQQKNNPTQNHEERKVQLEGCKYVDEIIIYESETDLYDLLKRVQPDVRFISFDRKGKSFVGDDLNIKIVFSEIDYAF